MTQLVQEPGRWGIFQGHHGRAMGQEQRGQCGSFHLTSIGMETLLAKHGQRIGVLQWCGSASLAVTGAAGSSSKFSMTCLGYRFLRRGRLTTAFAPWHRAPSAKPVRPVQQMPGFTRKEIVRSAGSRWASKCRIHEHVPCTKVWDNAERWPCPTCYGTVNAAFTWTRIVFTGWRADMAV